MSSFSAKGLTNKGRSLQAKAQAGAQLKYTKVVIGDGQLGGQSITALTNVISSKKTIDVTRLKMTPPNQATVGFVLSNQDVTTGFYFREIGVFAMDPDEGEILYYYLNAGDTADYIPPTGTGDLINKNFDVLVYVGQAQSVTLSVDTNLAYVTHKELDEALEGLDPDIPDASLTQKGLVQLSNATNGTRESVAATEKAVKAAYDEALAGKQLGVERKAEVVAALNFIGVTASTSETWAQLIPKIAAVIRASGNATAADLLAGKTASNASGPITGSMPNRGALTLTPGPSALSIPAGYHNGSGVVPAVVVPAGNVLAGTTIAGTPGTMPNRGAGGTVTPGTINQTKDAGYYSSPITILGDPDLIESNIRAGVNIFGKNGTLQEGKKYIEIQVGALAGNQSQQIDLGFEPKVAVVYGVSNASSYPYGSLEGEGLVKTPPMPSSGQSNYVTIITFKVGGSYLKISPNLQRVLTVSNTQSGSYRDVKVCAWE
ncbi:tail fiber repeat 2 protein [Paenibacillus algicola]|uniref:Tail fiber repeat 2 protein n=1 Tax=Paenibacillus algicola TaxID=2565926 RepID=A0A4P8XMY6_9BACL|nr:tail fiber protein [Paenibacillus algicola]QCT03803.1 tail fiber repeat 2 protein [Paenibacillus algicola]